jgi:hypothetical protein
MISTRFFPLFLSCLVSPKRIYRHELEHWVGQCLNRTGIWTKTDRFGWGQRVAWRKAHSTCLSNTRTSPHPIIHTPPHLCCSPRPVKEDEDHHSSCTPHARSLHRGGLEWLAMKETRNYVSFISIEIHGAIAGTSRRK